MGRARRKLIIIKTAHIQTIQTQKETMTESTRTQAKNRYCTSLEQAWPTGPTREQEGWCRRAVQNKLKLFFHDLLRRRRYKTENFLKNKA